MAASVFTSGSLQNFPPFTQRADISTNGREYDCYQDIGFTPENLRFSRDEIRLAHYKLHGGPLLRSTMLPASLPAVSGPGQKCLSSRRSATADPTPGSRTTTFLVDSPPVKFVAHHSIVTQASVRFRVLSQFPNKTGWSDIFVASRISASTFTIWQKWLYSKKICTQSPIPAESLEEYRTLVNAYMLGEDFKDIAFKDAVLDCIVEKMQETKIFDTKLTGMVYSNTPLYSPLRRLWRDVYLWTGDVDWLARGDASLHKEFLLDLARAQMGLRISTGTSVKSPFTGDHTCRYHEHATGDCYKLGKFSHAIPRVLCTANAARSILTIFSEKQYSLEDTAATTEPAPEHTKVDSRAQTTIGSTEHVEGKAIVKLRLIAPSVDPARSSMTSRDGAA